MQHGDATARARDAVGARRDTSAMVLCAGLGTRLRPLTSNRAKAVVPFLNRPLLDYTFDWLRRGGFDRTVINLHHAPESVVSAYGSRAFGMRVEYSFEPELLGTAGGPRKAIEQLGDRVVLVNGDVLTRLPLGTAIRRHAASNAQATLVLHTGDQAIGYPLVTATDEGELVAFPADDPDAPQSPGTSRGLVRGVFTGVHVVDRAVIETVPADRSCGIVDPVYRSLLAAGLAVDAIALPGTWYEIGTPARYLDAQLASLRRQDLPLALQGYERLLSGGFGTPDTHVENVRLEPPFLLDSGVRVMHGAFASGVIAGRRARIGAGARLEDVVAWPNARIGPGARLRRVIVLDGVDVPPKAELQDAVATRDGIVPFATTATAASAS